MWRSLLACGFLASFAMGEELPTRLRRPVDAIWIAPGQTLLTANSRSGSVSLLAVPQRETLAEFPVGGELVDLEPLGPPGHVVAVDYSGNQLVWLEVDPANRHVTVAKRLAVGRGPLMAISLNAQTLAVTSRWDRTIERITFETASWPPRVRERQAVSLPFAPRLMLLLPGGDKLVVTDNHADQLAVIDVASWTAESMRAVQGHNIRGLILSEKGTSIALAQQMMNQQVATSLDAVRDGTLMQNVVRVIPVQALRDPLAILPAAARTIFLGQTSEGAADPSGLAQDADGGICVSLGGIDQLALLTDDGIERQRPPMGRRPTQVLPVPGRAEVLVVNTFSDSLTHIDTRTARIIGEISLGPMPPLTPADRGELLFHDGRMSLDHWMSCHSCHTNGHANGALTDTLGDGSRGTPKRVLSLLGGRDANPWGWTGESRELHAQVAKTIVTTMQSPPRPATQINDLVAYMHTLEPAPPLQPATTDPTDLALLETGERLFHAAGCVRCHIPPLTFTSDGVFDVGMVDEAGHKTFNPPLLRGVSQRDSYFHDGSAQTLTEVLETGHFTSQSLSEGERAALVRYLRSL